ncbi:MAG: isoprenylcysteine carboxylmethyltransferase family protein [Planctomycetes bacterium]|nr:isoprenylcysteine carboxylmethyltransferase family protein [Planctomycetota bacterium]
MPTLTDWFPVALTGTVMDLSTMNPWCAKGVILLASLVMVVIRAPHGHRSRTVPVARSRKGSLELVLLTIAWAAFFLPLIWIAAPLFEFADYPLHPIPFLAGCLCLVLGLWLFHRSHADLGTNWSITLEVRDKHQLITHGVYRWVRHPMYAALLIYSAGQALVVPNWLVGPSYGVAIVLLIVLRLQPEERMMRDEFGKDYEAYTARTKRLIPGVW